MKINQSLLENIVKDKKYRHEKWENNEPLKGQLSIFLDDFKDWIKSNIKLKSYNIASMILSIRRWIIADRDNERRFDSDRDKRPKPLRYEPREIVYIDLGSTNYGVEASYEHPAVVLHNGYYFLVVIPCSSGRVSKSDYIINGGESDNFQMSTGIQIDQIRTIDKSRVIKRTNKKIPVNLSKNINNKILEKYLYPIKKEKSRIEQEKSRIEQEKSRIEEEKSRIEEVNKTLEEENNYLKQQIELLREEAAITKQD